MKETAIESVSGFKESGGNAPKKVTGEWALMGKVGYRIEIKCIVYTVILTGTRMFTEKSPHNCQRWYYVMGAFCR